MLLFQGALRKQSPPFSGRVGVRRLACSRSVCRVDASSPPILSPCIGLCELGSEGLCLGCFRTANEIAGWISFSPAQRQYLMDFALPQRAETPPRV